ncbi:hypothetical protein VT52_014665 [Streptomyces malaysiense]|uniref:Uncharacterized protein n=1 Tax=Streptomyces malaysiense TaxID=1428626 RepID=A0A1J4Q2F3_9ACTN|nr:hypothetical protein VT52_014665 [Streptomyces malaysiense]
MRPGPSARPRTAGEASCTVPAPAWRSSRSTTQASKVSPARSSRRATATISTDSCCTVLASRAPWAVGRPMRQAVEGG